jgi:hypothetical protein
MDKSVCSWLHHAGHVPSTGRTYTFSMCRSRESQSFGNNNNNWCCLRDRVACGIPHIAVFRAGYREIVSTSWSAPSIIAFQLQGFLTKKANPIDTHARRKETVRMGSSRPARLCFCSGPHFASRLCDNSNLISANCVWLVASHRNRAPLKIPTPAPPHPRCPKSQVRLINESLCGILLTTQFSIQWETPTHGQCSFHSLLSRLWTAKNASHIP